MKHPVSNFTRNLRVKSTPITDDQLRAYVPLVGKNSRYLRSRIGYYVQGLGKLKRSSVETQTIIDEEKIKNRNLSRGVRQKNLFNMTSEYTYRIMNILKETMVVLNLQNEAVNPPVVKRLLPKHYYGKVPAIPKKLDPNSFADYVHTLTHSEFYHNKASKNNGLIASILRDLVISDNVASSRFLTNVGVFNDTLHFFSRKRDIASMNEVKYKMQQMKVPENTKTINLFISQLKWTSENPHKTDPWKKLHAFLRRLEQLYLAPDLTTFTLVYNCLPEMASKILLIEFMTKHNVPITSRITRSIMLDLLANMKPVDAVAFFAKQDTYVLDTHCYDLLIDKLLSEKHYEKAWALVKNPGVSTMNIFLKQFANHERIDLCIGAFNTFQKKHHIRPNIVSYHQLIKCSVKTGFHTNWRALVRVFYHQSIGLIGDLHSEISSYWLLRARARSLTDKLNKTFLRLKPALTQNERELQHKWSDIVWKNEIIVDPSAAEPQYKSAAFSAGYSKKHHIRDPTRLTQSHGKAKRYLKRIKHTAIMNLYRKRVKYLEGGVKLGTLMEMNDAGVLSEKPKLIRKIETLDIGQAPGAG